MKVTLIASTQFWSPSHIPWETDAIGGQALVELAGRACYNSWSKPNPKTATNAGYIKHILEVGHNSVLEHGTVTFYLEGISRSLTHEFVRSRHFSYSQLSQRFVDSSTAKFVKPPALAGDEELSGWFDDCMEEVQANHAYLMGRLEHRLKDDPDGTAKKKAIRQAARSVLPNATATSIVVTGNYRAMRHFVNIRATEHADVEIRALAVEMLRHLQKVAPNVFADYEISTLSDGTEVASSPYGGGDD